MGQVAWEADKMYEIGDSCLLLDFRMFVFRESFDFYCI